MDKEIGKVTHFFDRISVAIIALNSDLAVGDKVKFVNEKRGINFEQAIGSLQLDHKDVWEGGSGTEVATKTNQMVKEGTLVFKVNS